MAAAFPRVNELLAGEAYTKLAFNHNNPDPELRKVEEAGRVCPQRPPFYVPFGQGVSLFTKAVHGGVSRILMQSAALTPMKRMVVTEPNIFDVYGHKHGLPDAVYDDSEQGARLRWRMAFGEHAPAQLPGMQVDADDNVVRCTPLSRAEQDTLLTLLFDIEIPGRQLPQQQQQQQQQHIRMKVVAAYLLAALGGNAAPAEADIKKILSSVGIEAEAERVQKLLAELEGKDINEVIAAGTAKLASVPSGGAVAAGGAAPAAGGAAAAAEEKKEEKVEEEEDEDMGFSLMLGLLLSTVSTSACVMAYTGGIGIPFNLLLMAPPTAVMGGGSMRLDPYGPPSPRVRFAGDDASSAAASDAALADQAAAAATAGDASGGSAFEAAAAVPPSPERGILSSASAGTDMRRRRLMYSKSGVLVSPTDFAAAWSKKFWFSSALSLTAFACMMCMLGTGRDAATYGYAPF
ncbi:60S acidic ribosomal P2 [Chlorella sorokiniana]|uniref:60S acidic ribosomal P2 n=1 Tax=Chlorella sorokiniana TaxID=3076 RepID=A0A2P6TIB0_CHLSO|nr:60S acidic ribosomal P2 [Chlorella sorokiniana]|eukprot:PRW34006.1 60S acidic ribosomal P2 [Chlorella sorokiniana]